MAGKTGRPKAKNPRSKIIAVRFRDDELADLTHLAAASHQSISEFMRAAAFGQPHGKRLIALDPADRHDLSRIGINLNQIARSTNAGHGNDAGMAVAELRALLQRLDHELV